MAHPQGDAELFSVCFLSSSSLEGEGEGRGGGIAALFPFQSFGFTLWGLNAVSSPLVWLISFSPETVLHRRPVYRVFICKIRFWNNSLCPKPVATPVGGLKVGSPPRLFSFCLAGVGRGWCVSVKRSASLILHLLPYISHCTGISVSLGMSSSCYCFFYHERSLSCYPFKAHTGNVFLLAFQTVSHWYCFSQVLSTESILPKLAMSKHGHKNVLT